MDLPWKRPVSIWDDDGPVGVTEVEVGGHRFKVAPTNGKGIHTGRTRFRVTCLTCGEEVHSGSTSATAQIRTHLTARSMDDPRDNSPNPAEAAQALVKRDQAPLSMAEEARLSRMARKNAPMPNDRHTLAAVIGEIESAVMHDQVLRDRGLVQAALAHLQGLRTALDESRETQRRLHRRTQAAESYAWAKLRELKEVGRERVGAYQRAKEWAEEHGLQADWTQDLDATWWRYTSENNRAILAVLVQERDRLRRILAVEQGDESQAPEGWVQSTGWPWVKDDGTHEWGVRRLARGWSWFKWYQHAGSHGTAPTALEAMEAADAAMEDR